MRAAVRLRCRGQACGCPSIKASAYVHTYVRTYVEAGRPSVCAAGAGNVFFSVSRRLRRLRPVAASVMYSCAPSLPARLCRFFMGLLFGWGPGVRPPRSAANARAYFPPPHVLGAAATGIVPSGACSKRRLRETATRLLPRTRVGVGGAWPWTGLWAIVDLSVALGGLTDKSLICQLAPGWLPDKSLICR